MSDKFEITDLLNQYAVLLDLGRIDECTNLFSETASLELRIGIANGKNEIKELLLKILKFTTGKRHFISNTNSQIDGDNAKASCYLLVIDATNTPQVIMTGVYMDELIKEEGIWKIKNRKLLVDPSFK
jgi:hypothetical protein